ncbi:MAG: hypothetical protein HY515_02225 [Candidatus Aenigmarchaeota archaeon]|nr:hypothetical protein [Candidatus Aenigmarchaeota archaeon]
MKANWGVDMTFFRNHDSVFDVMWSFLGKMADAAGYIAFAALVGELADHTPYLNTAVPNVMKAFTDSDYFFGNLDKVGATIGFFSFYTSSFRITRRNIGV